MSRSLWKGPFSSLKEPSTSLPLAKATATVNQPLNNNLQNTWCRHSMILPKDIGKQLKIHNGKSWVLRKITESMVGHKFGEFSFTKKKVIHKIDKKKQTPKKK